MRRPTIIILSCMSFIAGTIVGYNFLFSPNFWWTVFCIFSALASLLLSRRLKFIPIVLCGAVLGLAIITYQQNYISQYGLSGSTYKKLEISGDVKGDPYWDKDRNYVFTLTNLNVDGASRVGDVRIKTFSSAVKEGYRVTVVGKIFPIMAKPGYQISYGTVKIASFNQPVMVMAKQLFYSGIDRSLEESPAGFLKGILVGARSSLPLPLQQTLNEVGLSHIVAVSGYNLTILVVILQRLLKKRWLWASLIISLALVWSFTILTGASASILRAAVMATVFLIASYYGRPLSVFTCISITAAITLLINPSSAVEDIGWQLSFLSLIGIVVLAPIITTILPKKTPLLSDLVAVTFAAQIATVPYLLYLFGSYSIASIISNMVLMPIIPLMMLAGFLIAIVGILAPSWGYILASPLAKLISIIFDFLQYLQSQKGLIVVVRPQTYVLVIWYLLICILGAIVYHRNLDTSLASFQMPDRLVK